MKLNGLLLGFVLAFTAYSQTPSDLVNVTPCRVVDTRDSARGDLGAPYLTGDISRDFLFWRAPAAYPPLHLLTL